MTVHDNLVAALSIVLRERRLQLCFSQNDLAYKSGIHRSYIGDLERGCRNISVKNLSRLAQALQINSSTLLSLAEETMTTFTPLDGKRKIRSSKPG